jgi:DNA replication protein DnaC
MSMQEINDNIDRAKYEQDDDTNGKSQSGIIANLKNVSLLIVDDFGNECFSKYASSYFAEIIKHRAAKLMATVICTSANNDCINGIYQPNLLSYINKYNTIILK